MKTLTLHLDGVTPSDLSLKRLADYLCELEELYGPESGVHFSSITKGSADLNANVADEQHPAVMLRVREIANGVGPKKASKAYQRLADLMLDDQATGSLVSEGCQIIQFPRVKRDTKPLVLFKQGSVQGRLYIVGGKDDTVPVRLEGANGETLYCEADVPMAEQLAPLLFKQVRLHGDGEWERRQTGGWRLKKLHVLSYQPLEQSSLKQALGRMKDAGGIKWTRHDSPHDSLSGLRG